ncbi:MAG TPA: DUF3127 domain-containing protein [Bacteroidia bacterium]|nr:DUF3127 domain-containing protein [Bacteroidia bacterium]
MTQSTIGILLHKFEEKHITDNFKIKDFIVKTDFNKEFPQELSFQLQNTKCDFINDIPLGIQVKVYFEIKGKMYNNGNEKKWFNTLVCFKIEKVPV